MAEPSLKPGSLPLLRFRVGHWLADSTLDELRLDERIVKVEPRAMRVLAALAEVAGQVVTTDALLDVAWPGVIVTPNSLHQVVASLRRILRSDAATGEFIVTVPRRGYRLLAPVVADDSRLPQPDAGIGPAPTPLHGLAPEANANTGASAASLPDLGPRSVAVLPFRLHRVPESHDVIGEVLLDDLIAELSRHPNLKTIARGTMLSYAGCQVDPRQLARELGVRYLVDGRIDFDGAVLRVAVHLVDAFHAVQQWSDSIELALGAWAELGRLVIGRLARSLSLEVVEGSSMMTGERTRGEDEAYRLAMRAWSELYCRPQSRTTNDRALQWADQALALDDRIAPAWNALAYAGWRAAQYGWLPGDPWALLEQAHDRAQKAIELAPRDPDAHYTLALIANLRRLPMLAEAALANCLSLCPSYAPGHGLLGLVRAHLGFPEETGEHVGRAFALSPREPLRAIWYWALANSALLLEDNETALAQVQRGLAINEQFTTLHVGGAVAAHRLGRDALARAFVERLVTTTAFPTVSAVRDRLPGATAPGHGPRLLADLAAAGLPP